MTKYANAAAAAAAAAADKKAGQAARDKAMKDAKDKALRTDKTKGPQLSKRGGHPPPRRGPNDVDKSASIRAELKKMRKNPPVSDPPAPKPRSVAFDPVTGIPPKGKQPPTKPMQPKGSYDPPRPTKPMTTTPGDRSPAFPIFKGGYTPTPKKKPTGPMTPMPNEGIGPTGPRLDPRGPVKAAMAKGGRVSLSPKAKKSSSVGNVRKFSHGGKIDGCAVRGKTNTKKF